MKHEKIIDRANRISTAGLGQPQQGVALAMALMVLVVLTILGISGMKTGLLQSRMSVNAQESTIAFNGAESVLATVLASNIPLSMNSTPTYTTYTPPSTPNNTTVVISSQYEGRSPPPRGNTGSSILQFEVANRRYEATSSTVSGAKSVVAQGQSQLINKVK